MFKKIYKTIRKIVKKVISKFNNDVQCFITGISTRVEFSREFKYFKQYDGKRFQIKDKYKYPCLDDKTKITEIEPHYIYHTAWAARKVKEIAPNKHIDISSYIYFSTLVSSFIPIEFYDYRPVDLKLSGLKSSFADLNSLPFLDNSVHSLSCMHVIEHIGLGRYGDKIDEDGDIKAISELKRVISPNGFLLFVVPISGNPRIEFNAHRVYSYNQITSFFKDYKLVEFSLVTDKGRRRFIENATEQDANQQRFGCGCFFFQKSK